LLAVSARADDKITLKIHLTKGDEYKQVTKMEMATKMQMGDKPMDMTMKAEMEASMLVENVDAAGVQTVKTAYTATRMKMGGPMAMEYDSSKPADANNPMGKMMGAMIDKSVTLKIGPDGQIKDVTSEGNNQALIAQMKNSLIELTGWVPKHPVSIGDSWTSKMDMSAMTKMPMAMDMKYTLVSRKDGVAQIKMDGTMSGKMEGTVKGTVGIDEKTGWPMSHDMDMNVKMVGQGQAPGIEMKMEMSQTTTKK